LTIAGGRRHGRDGGGLPTRHPEDTWLGKLMLRKPRILVAIALANKMARRIWAMLTKGESYRDPALAEV
jgi:hypothetical protein